MSRSHPSRRRVVGLGASAGALALLGRPLRAQDGPADLVVLNARVTTMDRARPEAQAVAVREGRFVAVGGAADVQRFVGPATTVIDAEGRRMIPGLNDSHTHKVREGLNYALELRWDGIATLAEAMARLRAMVARTPPGHWVRVVGGFSPNQFAEGRMPTLDELNAVAPDTPVYVLFLYTHALLNRAALAALRVDRATPDNRWPAARIERDQTGLPTGLFVADPAPVILYDSIWRAPQLSFEQALVSTRHFMREQTGWGSPPRSTAAAAIRTGPRTTPSPARCTRRARRRCASAPRPSSNARVGSWRTSAAGPRTIARARATTGSA